MIYVPASSLDDWKMLLADPKLHWKDGYSAKSLALSWYNANGFPPSILEVLHTSKSEAFKDLEFLLAIPEYKVDLPGGARPSQNDLFVLARSPSNLVAIMVEGKAKESFGPLVSEWKLNDTTGKDIRLKYLLELLNITEAQIPDIRYQLLHRTASVIIEGNRFNCPVGLMMVHSFADSSESFNDYKNYLSLYNLIAERNHIVGPVSFNSIAIYFAWIQ
jgi:hypothetical protein